MKKLTILAALSILSCIFGLELSAAYMTFKVTVDNPENVVISAINPREINIIEFTSGEAEVGFYSTESYTIEIDPQNDATFSVDMVLADGTVTNLATDSNMRYWTHVILPSWDKGVMKITTKADDVDNTKSQMNVTLTGNPENVNFSLYGRSFREVPLVEGSQQVEFNASTDSYCYILPVKVSKFYSVKIDGTELEPMGFADENRKISYQYVFTPEKGMQVDIFVSDPSKVNTITADDETSAIYNINGVRVGDSTDSAKLPGGVYIVNGKKIIIK